MLAIAQKKATNAAITLVIIDIIFAFIFLEQIAAGLMSTDLPFEPTLPQEEILEEAAREAVQPIQVEANVGADAIVDGQATDPPSARDSVPIA